MIDKNKKKINQVRKVTKKNGSNKEKHIVNKSIYILGDTMVKNVEGWKLRKSIRKDHNVYVRSFSGAKVKCMKDYVKPL